ncbi:hypothetical protein TWF788_000925 [Orbilia oligospora]|uniref:DNA-directed DNA polymerase n=1 Tax=Orbilia oligospora TaxID=2813651 RepID=A0A7C8Q0Z1_ORBOL|nr:hypothetical protein TWF788_000925 [Orbilia oligospora]
MAPTTTHFLPAPEVRKRFAGLSKDDENERLEAAKGLNLALRNVTENRDETVKYCLTRLIKGLTSANDSSRIGFSLALVELLYSLLDPKDPLLTDLPFRSVVQLIVEHTEPTGGLTKSEERGFYFGRLFGLKAIIETELLFTKESDISNWQSVLTQLVVLAQKKPWLRESCCLVIRNAVLAIESSQKELVKVTCDELEKSGLIKSSDGIGIWIALIQKHNTTLEKLNIRPQKRSSPFEKAYLQTLAKILKESEGKDEDGEKLAQKGSWNARLSWVWDSIFEFYTSDTPQKDIASFPEFWQAVVNDGLFSNSSSDERKFWGFLVFNKAISALENKDTISILFSPNLMKCFINQLSSPERYLHKAAQKSFRVIKSKAENSPSIASTILTCLLSRNGSPNFESVTKTKVIESLFSCADEQGQLEIVRFFKSLILEPAAEDTKSIEKSRQWAADQLLSTIRSSKSTPKSSYVTEIINIFVEYGHFNIKSNLSADLAFSATTQATFRTRLSSCLSELLQNSDLKSTVWSAKAVLFIKQKREESADEFATTVDESIEEEIEKVFKIVSKLDRKTPALGSRRYAFALMYSLLLLQLFNGEPDAMDMLQDLHLVFEKIGKERKEKERKKDKHRHKRQKHEPEEQDHDHEEEEEEEEEQDCLEILIELLLGFLAKPSVLAKKMSQTVFKSFADSLSASALDSLLRPLVVEETQEGQRELFDIEDEDEIMDDADSGEDDDGEDSDVEVIDVEEDSADEEDGEDDENEDEDEESSDEEEDDDDDDDGDDDEPLDEETRKLHAALAEALGTSKDPNTSDASDSDESMDDDQMLLVDEQLSKIFKHRKTPNKRQQRASAKESVVNFKNRILELLEIYVKGDGNCDEKIKVIVPCLEAMRKTGNPSVRSNAHNVLKSLAQSNKKKSPKDKEDDTTTTIFTDPSSAFEILKQIHQESSQPHHQPQQSREHAASCSHCSLYISRILVAGDKSWIERITELYFTKTMVNWMTDAKCVTQPALFTDFVTWAGTIRKSLTTAVLTLGGEKVEVTGKSGKSDKKRKRKNK